MLFNSYIFMLFFFPLVLIGYFSLNRWEKYTASKLFLILASLFFYGYYNWWYLLIIVFSVVLNYTFSQVMLDKNRRKHVRELVFALALFINIGSLFFFKYYDFFIENVNAIFQTSLPFLRLALPLGISFFTFQQLSYVIDSYRFDEGVRKYNFLDYALFVTYFPQLIAGPIVTHDEMVPQFADVSRKHFNYNNFAAGLWGFTLGLAKKIIIADTFGVLVDNGFSQIARLGSVNAILVMLSYTFQIYFDFSGYCDMATGIGKMMNLDIAVNFNSPYKAVGIVDFWKRWHITLTRFFTKYVYIPLGGNRKGSFRTYANIMIVFLVSGIWHGANWTFIVWGLLHGAANVITRLIDKKTGWFSSKRSKMGTVLFWFFTFAFVNLTWVIFRADSLSQAREFFCQLTGLVSSGNPIKLITLLGENRFVIIRFLAGSVRRIAKHLPLVMSGIFAVTAGFCVFSKNTNERIKSFRPTVLRSVAGAFLLVWCILLFGTVSTFLYWNF